VNPVSYWERLKRRGVSRKTVEYIYRQHELEIPVSMIVQRLKKRREVDKKLGKSSTDFMLSEASVWNIIYQHRRFLENQKQG